MAIVTRKECFEPSKEVIQAIQNQGINETARKSGVTGAYISSWVNGKLSMPFSTYEVVLRDGLGIKGLVASLNFKEYK